MEMNDEIRISNVDFNRWVRYTIFFHLFFSGIDLLRFYRQVFFVYHYYTFHFSFNYPGGEERGTSSSTEAKNSPYYV